MGTTTFLGCTQCCGGIPVSCGACGFAMPLNWTLTNPNDIANNGCSGCTILNVTPLNLAYLPAGQPNHGVEISNGCYWQSNVLGAVCVPGTQAFWQLRFLTSITFTWELQLVVGATVLFAYTPISQVTFNCLAANNYVGGTWIGGTCSGAATATITPA